LQYSSFRDLVRGYDDLLGLVHFRLGCRYRDDATLDKTGCNENPKGDQGYPNDRYQNAIPNAPVQSSPPKKILYTNLINE
jgi:hypothetical protein